MQNPVEEVAFFLQVMQQMALAFEKKCAEVALFIGTIPTTVETEKKWYERAVGILQKRWHTGEENDSMFSYENDVHVACQKLRDVEFFIGTIPIKTKRQKELVGSVRHMIHRPITEFF